MKKLIFLFALVFAFTFNVKAQDIAMIDASDNISISTENDATDKQWFRLGTTGNESLLLRELNNIVKKDFKLRRAVQGFSSNTKITVYVIEMKTKKFFKYDFNFDKEIINITEITKGTYKKAMLEKREALGK
jgi:hypothetical protein